MFKKLSLHPNPIIIKELRSRMRGPRPFITLTAMLVLFSGITYGGYRLATSYFDYYTGAPLSPQIGQMLFTMLIFLLLLFILIITPAVTANAVSQEKENLTYEILMTKPLHPAKILWGKLFSAMSYVLLLIFAAIPIASLIFVFGGVTLRDMLKSAIILIAIAITVGIFGLFLSTLLKRSTRATVISYVVIAVFIIGSIILFGVIGVITQGEPPRWILVMNPISILASGMSATNYNSYTMGFLPILAADLSALTGSTFAVDYIPRPLYHYSLPLYGGISLILFAFSTRLILPTRRWQISRKDVLVFLSMLLVLLAVFIIGLFATMNNYERAIVPDSPVVRNFIGPLIRSAPVIRPQMAVEVAVEEAVPVPEEVAILELADSDFPAIYSLVLPEVLELSQEIDDLTSTSTLLLIANIDSLANDGSTYILPEKSQFVISEELQELDYDVIWVQTIEDALIILEEQETDALVIDFSPFTIGVDDTASSKISIFQQVDNIFEYKFTLSSNQGEWIINESELSN